MKGALAAGFALLAGFALALIGLLAAEDMFSGIWLPCALVAALFALLGMTPKLRTQRWPYGFCVATGTVLLWLSTRDARVTKLVIHTEKDLLTLTGLSFLGWILVALFDKKRGPTLALFLLMACFWLVAYFSGGSGGSSHMSDWFQRLFHVDVSLSDGAMFWVRKSIHFLFYGTVGLLALLIGRRGGATAPILFGLLVALTLSSFDEHRQGYFDNRTSSVYDVGLDMAGAGTFVALASLKRKATE